MIFQAKDKGVKTFGAKKIRSFMDLGNRKGCRARLIPAEEESRQVWILWSSGT